MRHTTTKCEERNAPTQRKQRKEAHDDVHVGSKKMLRTFCVLRNSLCDHCTKVVYFLAARNIGNRFVGLLDLSIYLHVWYELDLNKGRLRSYMYVWGNGELKCVRQVSM